MTNLPKTIGITWGNPGKVTTYCGMPYFLFRGLRKKGILQKAINSEQFRPVDLFTGAFDWKRSFEEKGIRRTALWRYYPENIEKLSARYRKKSARLPEHSTVLEFDAVVIPPEDKKLVAYIEMSVETAITETFYADSHGYTGFSEEEVKRAIEGEKQFLSHCDIIWTNSEWTAEGLKKQGVPEERIRIYAPPSGVQNPGVINRNWNQCNLLFIGIDWYRKGGDILVEAFKIIRKEIPTATLTIIGCNPQVKEEGVQILGFLRKNKLEEAKLFRKALHEATIYCMPTRWDTTGIPYMEAGMYGLPVVMTKGQGREGTFSEDMSVFTESLEPQEVADSVIALHKDSERMKVMGAAGRKHVLDHYTWDVGIEKVEGFLREIKDQEK